MPQSRKRAKKVKPRRRPSYRSRAPRSVELALNRRDETAQAVWDMAVDALPPECRRARVSDPVEAEELLHEARRSIEKLGTEFACAMGSYTWLFYLRRLPSDLFSGRLGTTGPYRQLLAELISSLSTTSDVFPELSHKRQVMPPIDGTGADALIRLCALTAPLATIHAALRRAGKGQYVQWHWNDLPWVIPDEDLDRAIEIYDTRVDGDKGIGAGTQVSQMYPFFGEVPGSVRLSDLLLSVQQLPEPTLVPTWDGPARSPRKFAPRRGRFVAGGETLSLATRMLAAAASAETWASPTLSALILALRAFFRAAFEGDFAIGRSLPEVGYFVFPAQSVPYVMENEYERTVRLGLNPGPAGLPESVDVAYEHLAAISPSLWPVEIGPVFRPAGEQTVVDISSAGMWLHRLLTVDRDAPPDLVNARALHFEKVVQDTIDETVWRPSSELVKLRGKTLRLGSNSITDIDALATRGSVLLLVSCKSIPHTAELDSGVYDRVRNVRTNLEEYDAYWQDRMDWFRANSIGDNYNFSGHRIVGTVCTPHVEFTHLEQTRFVTDTLRAVISLDELGTYLQSG
jgi:hypothetical protein